MMILEAIHKINPNAECIVKNDDIDNIEWLNGTTPIPKEDIEVALTEVQDEYDAKQYQRDRKAEYPPIAEQLDYIYHHGVTKWKTDMITPVKEKYPKPE